MAPATGSDAVLVADIGGTRSRFALADGEGRLSHLAAVENDELSSLQDGIAAYLASVAVKPQAAVLGVASPAIGEEVVLTNRDWRFRPEALKRAFGLRRIKVVNDFEALAYALPQLQPGDLRRLGGKAAEGPGAKAVLGPGTGLGVAGLLPQDGGWVVIASEGGHASFGAASAEEEPVFARLRQERPVSAETILSVRGLVRLHAALHPGAGPETMPSLLRKAAAGEAFALETTRLFVRLLGRFAGDLALTFKATGGVFLAGGVAQALGSLLDADLFRRAFEAHPPASTLLQAIPTHLITADYPGLIGCAALARRL